MIKGQQRRMPHRKEWASQKIPARNSADEADTIAHRSLFDGRGVSVVIDAAERPLVQ